MTYYGRLINISPKAPVVAVHYCRSVFAYSVIFVRNEYSIDGGRVLYSGVIILHLLLVPGSAFLAGGARVWEQTLHPHNTQLNHSLLTIG